MKLNKDLNHFEKGQIWHINYSCDIEKAYIKKASDKTITFRVFPCFPEYSVVRTKTIEDFSSKVVEFVGWSLMYKIKKYIKNFFVKA